MFVFDARVAVATLKQSETTAASLSTLTSIDVTTNDLPGRGLGISGGLHVYPIRTATFAFGIGGELLLVSASRQNKDAMDLPIGPAVKRRLQSLSGQISLNFGHREGWSYLTAGM